MDSRTDPTKGDFLADRFAAIWKESDAPPDVLAFLATYPDVALGDRIDVLRIDQRFRWHKGISIPVESYVEKIPELATRPDLLDALIQEERRARLGLIAPGDTALDEWTPEGFGLVDEPLSFAMHWPVASSLDTQSELVAGVPRGSALPMTDAGTEPFTLEIESTPESSIDAPPALSKIGRFTVQRRLGAGGMGVVYQAHDHERDEIVALKTMRRVDPMALYRFKQEFRTLAGLSHPNLVNLEELFAQGDFWFFTMELIVGVDFITYVRSERAGAATEEEADDRRLDRLRKALGQLAQGIIALHDAGKLHRDIKPTNVLVTEAGRVVLLDFGLTTELWQVGGRGGGEETIVGTAGYMSPEQGTAGQIGTASDWYSVGVILYEALTGELPFTGTVREVLRAKRRLDPPPASALVANLPADLDELCTALLRRDPTQRPTGRDVLDRLQCAAATVTGFDLASSSQDIPLIGRERHRRILDAAFSSVKLGMPESLYIFGRSGTGKSTLVQTFLEDLVRRDQAVVLSGCCHLRESVPYKALDSVVDGLSRYLTQLDPDVVEALLPRDAALLARVFPVLRRVEALADAPESTPHSPDSTVDAPDLQELKRRAFVAFRALLTRLGDHKPLVISIDDLHWGNLEDGVLIAELLRPPDAPVLLFLGSFRSEDAETSPILRALYLGKNVPTPGRHELAVETLSLAESRELALALLGHDHPSARAEAYIIARESRGNPFFINALVKYAQGVGRLSERQPAAGEELLDEVIWAQIERLPGDARRMLEAIVVAGRPIGQSEVSRALGLSPDGRASAAGVLRAARLIRSTGPVHHDEIEIYHDRIREVVTDHLDPPATAEYHRRLAQTLEGHGRADPEVLAYHYLGAGLLKKAGQYYAEAAERAAKELAFAHAARLFELALERLGDDAAAARRLRTRLGDALGSAGRGGDAARTYLAAAASAGIAEGLELKRRAAMQFLISGHVNEGLETLRSVLEAMGMAPSDTPDRAVRSLVLHRARLRLRGLTFRERAEDQISDEERTRIDVCWSAVAGLSIIDPIRGADFQVRGLLLALRAGEPYRIARALALEAAHASTAGWSSRRRVARLLRVAEPLAARVGHPHAIGMVALARAVASLMLGQWRSARESFDRVGDLFRERCTDVAWELDTIANLSLLATAHMGDLTQLRRRLPDLIKEARRRGDLYAATTLSADYRTILHLAEDESSAARHELEEIMANWTRDGFYVQHSAAFRSGIQNLLYQGDWQAAWDSIEAHWPSYERSLLSRIQVVRIQMLELRARCALAAAVVATDPEPFWSLAAEIARRLERERRPWAAAHAYRIRATIALARRDLALAVKLLADAARHYHDADMHLDAATARRRLGILLGGAHGQDLIREADEWLAEQGVRDPVRMTILFTPGFLSQQDVEGQATVPNLSTIS